MVPDEFLLWLTGGSVAAFVIITILCTTVPFVAILGGVGYLLIHRSRQAAQMRQSSLEWPSTTGTVIKSRVEVTAGGRHTSVRPRVVYEYEVFGVRYQNDQIRAGDRFMRVSTSQDAYDTVDRYPEGSTVTVYYNPANPAASALER